MEVFFMEIKVPIGFEFFDELINCGAQYVDKTELIFELLDQSEEKVILITRPRRFGKTLNMSMLCSFLDIKRDSEKIFSGLSVRRHESFCKEWMNQYPVIFMTLKDVESLSFPVAYQKLQHIIAETANLFPELAESEKTNAYDRNIFNKLMMAKGSEADTINSLKIITRMLKAYYGKPAILLIDEYDVPIAKARENGYYREMLDIIRGLLGNALKGNEFLKFAVITGCLRIVKESIFTGVNNFKSYSVLDSKLSQYFGFTQNEIDDLLIKAGMIDKKQTLRDWYDGYIFGKTSVYCPWDVVNYVADALHDPTQKPKNYWINTSGNGIIREFVENGNFHVDNKFETLLNRGTITQTITDALTYETLNQTEDNLWSVLLMTGYLTKADPKQEGETVALRIPNNEIAGIFEKTVMSHFSESLSSETINALMTALWDGDETTASEILSDLLFDTISYMDYHEDFYHAFLSGIFVGRGYEVDSNKERGLGRPDILLRDRKNRRALIIEAKRSSSEDCMEKDCRDALSQIIDREYAKNLKGYRKIMTYGITFFEKTALVLSGDAVKNLKGTANGSDLRQTNA